MLKPAQLYKQELQIAFQNTWYDDKYKFYHGSYCSTFQVSEDTYNSHQFVSVDKEGVVIGYIGYSIDRSTMSVYGLGIINFSDNKLVFSKDLYTALSDIFLRYQFNKLNFNVVQGNPIEKSYDRWINKFGGRIVGIYKQHTKLQDGELYDSKMYEIFRDSVLANGIRK